MILLFLGECEILLDKATGTVRQVKMALSEASCYATTFSIGK